LLFGDHEGLIAETEILDHSSARAVIAALHVFLRFYETVFKNPLKYGFLVITTLHFAPKVCEVLMPIDPFVQCVANHGSEFALTRPLEGIPSTASPIFPSDLMLAGGRHKAE
jgi:hypothetical protein